MVKVYFDKELQAAPSAVELLFGSERVSARDGLLFTPTCAYYDLKSNPLQTIATWFQTATGQLADTTGRFSNESFTLGDSAAPVLLSAVYLMAGEKGADNLYHDSVRTVFSENVRINGTRPLVIIRGLSNPELLRIDVTADRMSAFLALGTDQKTQAPRAGDSVRLAVDMVADNAGNVQRVTFNRAVALDVRVPPDVFLVHAGPTLFRPSGAEQFRIMLVPNERIGNFTSDSKADLAIYDPLGNVVLKEKFLPGENTFIIRWNGTNRRGAIVSQGTYLAIIDARINGRMSKKQVKIGVDR
jgi:hypothetical protein